MRKEPRTDHEGIPGTDVGPRKALVWFIGIGVLVILIYGQSLRNGFVWDDETFILKWPLIRTWEFAEFFRGVVPVGHEGVWRPFRTLLYAVAYHTWGVSAAWYHVHGLMLHLTMVILVYLLAARLTANRRIGLLSGLLFGIHPAASEAVLFATANFDLYAPIFYLLSLLMLVRRGRWRVLWYSASLVIAALAVVSGESALSLPLGAALVLWLEASNQGRRLRFRTFLPVLPFFVILGVYGVVRFLFLSLPIRTGGLVTQPYYLWAMMLRAIARYAEVLVFPLRLNTLFQVAPENIVIPAQGQLGLALSSLGHPPAIAGICVLIGLPLVAVFGRRRFPLVTFGIAWLVITFLPFSNIIPTNVAVAERYLYIPSVGLCIAAAWVLASFYRRTALGMAKQKTTLLLTVFAVLVFLLSARTYSRVFDWKNPLVLWTRTVRDSPQSSLAWNNLGKAYAAARRQDDALAAFRSATAINPKNRNAWYNIGQILASKKKYADAVSVYRQILASNPGDTEVRASLVHALAQTNNTDLAFEELERVLSSPTALGYQTKAFLELAESSTAEAMASYGKAISLDRWNVSSYNNLAVLHLARKEADKAIDLLTEAARIAPQDAEVYQNLAEAYRVAGKETEYGQALRRSEELRPGHERAKEVRQAFPDTFE